MSSLPDRGFLDTTILTDILLKPGRARNESRRALKQFSETLLPEFAITELCNGPMGHAIWLYNKLVETGSLIKTFEAIRAIGFVPFQIRRHHTALELWQVLHEAFFNSGFSLVEPGSSASALPETMFSHFRLVLRTLIVKAWKTRNLQATRTVNTLTCFQIRGPKIELDRFTPLRPICDDSEGCGLLQYFKESKPDVAKLRKLLHSQGPVSKRDNREQLLTYVLKRDSKLLKYKNCRALGDVVFALLCPPDAAIITTNLKDHEPLAKCLGKMAVRPTDCHN